MTDTTNPGSRDDVNSFLFGGGGRSAKFENPGDAVKGTVVSTEMAQQTDMEGKPRTWDDGSPRMQLVVTLQTDERAPDDADDDGIRKLYVKGGTKIASTQKAVADAVRAAGATQLEVGGTLAVEFTGLGQPSKPGYSAPKLYRAAYKPPAPAAVSADLLDQL